jgi:tetratricopeptide (TPR) repeat protein
VRDPEGELRGYKRDARGQAVLSTFHSDALKKLSDESGGRYWEISASESELDEVASEIGKLGTDDREERRNISYVDRYQWPLAIAVFLLIFELFLPARKVALLVLGVLWGANPVYADMQTYRANELALKALSENRPNDAKKHLAEAQSREPDLPELLANQAQTELLEKNVKDAAKSFQAAGELAEKQMRPDIAARSYYNAGTTSAQAGEFNEAVQNYLTAIDLAKKAKDLDVEKKARENLLLLKRQREQQKQNQEKQNEEKKQNDQDRKNQKDDQKDSGEGESKKDDQEEKGQDKKKNQELEDPSVSRERAQKKFESSKMSKEDAERVMAELSSREKELQRRLKKQKGQGQTQEKDW